MSTPGTGSNSADKSGSSAENDRTEQIPRHHGQDSNDSSDGRASNAADSSNAAADTEAYPPVTRDYVPGANDETQDTQEFATATREYAPVTGEPSERPTAQQTAAIPVSHTKHPDDARHYDDDAQSYRDDAARRSTLPTTAERQALLAREKETFGGMKFGSAFFGWLTATGMAILLTGLVAAAGTVFGLSTNMNLTQAMEQATQNAQTVGITGAIILLLILFLAYFAGGYVTGRMARFNGAKQGVAVWLWAVIIAVLITIIGLIIGTQLNVPGNIGLTINAGDLTMAGIIAVVAAALTALGAAVLGGLTGMRYHRKIDRADYDDASRR